MKKNSCTPINPKKYSWKGLKKIHTRNLITKKNSCSSKIPLPPHNFSNGPSLITTKRAQHRFAIPQKEVVKLNRKLKGRLWMIESRRRANTAGKLAGNSSSCCSPGLFQLLFPSSFKARGYMREICASGAV